MFNRKLTEKEQEFIIENEKKYLDDLNEKEFAEYVEIIKNEVKYMSYKEYLTYLSRCN